MKRNSHELKLSNTDKLKRTVGAGLAFGGLFLTACSNEDGLHIKYNDGTVQSVDDYLEDYEPRNGGNPANHDPGTVRPDERPALDIRKSAEALAAERALLAKHSKNLDEWREGTLDIISNSTSENAPSTEERAVLALPRDVPKSEYTDQEVINSVTLDIADASLQGFTEEEKARGVDMLRLVVSESSKKHFENLKDSIERGAGTIIASYTTLGESLTVPSGQFMNAIIEPGQEARLIHQHKNPGSQAHERKEFDEHGLYVLISDGTLEHWQLAGRYDPSESEEFRNILFELRKQQ